MNKFLINELLKATSLFYFFLLWASIESSASTCCFIGDAALGKKRTETPALKQSIKGHSIIPRHLLELHNIKERRPPNGA